MLPGIQSEKQSLMLPARETIILVLRREILSQVVFIIFKADVARNLVKEAIIVKLMRSI